MRSQPKNNLFSLEKPIHDLFALNMKTLESISYVHPVDFLATKNPEELLERNVDVLVQNGHQMLNYFHDACNIMEKYWLIFSYDVLDQNEKALHQGPLFDLEKIIKDSRHFAKELSAGAEKSARKNM